jgi:hypothetical protein
MGGPFFVFERSSFRSNHAMPNLRRGFTSTYLDAPLDVTVDYIIVIFL